MSVKVRVCIGSACHLKGSYDVITALKGEVAERHLEDKVDLAGVFCLGNCKNGVSVTVNDELHSVDGGDAVDFFETIVLPQV